MKTASIALLGLVGWMGPLSIAGCGDTRKPMITHGSSTSEPIKLPLPQFSLTDQDGAPFDSESMKGKVTVVDFVFTSCPTICPGLTKKMSSLVDETRDDPKIHYLSISVDPENDTPERMRAFLDRNGQQSPQWRFVTGDPTLVQKTVVQGFKIRVEKDKQGTLSHGEHFLVVDGKSTIRGYFEATPEGLGNLTKQARALSGEN